MPVYSSLLHSTVDLTPTPDEQTVEPELFQSNFVVNCTTEPVKVGLAHISLPFRRMDNGDQTCNLLSVYRTSGHAFVDVMYDVDFLIDFSFVSTTVFSFGHPILKYCQRFESVYDDVTAQHLVVVNNYALDSFMETFCQQFQHAIQQPAGRDTLTQNLILNQAVVEVSTTGGLSKSRETSCPSIELTVTFHSHRQQ